MKQAARMMMAVALIAMVVAASGCRYTTNRYYDFRDIWAVGAGITGENPVTGIVPPSLGLYLELTEFLHLGALTHNGMTAEMDLRGTFVGPESTTRFGFLWWQSLQKYQDYNNAVYMNAFKDELFPWSQRMASIEMSWLGRPAKRLHYQPWGMHMQRGSFLAHRGYQYWAYSGAQLALSDPILTHMGFMLRFGFDLSEVSDFLLGVVCVDALKRDDLTRDEYEIFRRRGKDAPCDIMGIEVVPAQPRI